MKKLLSLLGVISLTTTASISVVACGKADGDTGLQANEDLLAEQFENLQGLINTSFSNQISSDNDLVQVFSSSGVDQTDTNNFFKSEDLLKILGTEDNVEYSLEGKELESANTDIKNLFGYNEFVLSVQKQLTDDLSLVTKGINQIVNDMQLEQNISISSSGTGTDGYKQISVDMTVNVIYSYSDIQGNIQEGNSLQFDLSYQMVNDATIKDAISAVQTSLKAEVYTNGAFNINDKDLNIESTPFLTWGGDINFPELAKDSKLRDAVSSSAESIFTNYLDNANMNKNDLKFDFKKSGDAYLGGGDYDYDYSLPKLFIDQTNFEEDFKNTPTYKNSINTFSTNSLNKINTFLNGFGLDSDSDTTSSSETGLFWGNYTVSGLSFNLGGITIKVSNIQVPVVYSASNESFEALIKDRTELSEAYENHLNSSSLENIKTSDWEYVVANCILQISETLGFEHKTVSNYNDINYLLEINSDAFWNKLSEDPTIKGVTNSFVETIGQDLFAKIGLYFQEQNVNNKEDIYSYLFWLVEGGIGFDKQKNNELVINDGGISYRDSNYTPFNGFYFNYCGLRLYSYKDIPSNDSNIIKKG